MKHGRTGSRPKAGGRRRTAPAEAAGRRFSRLVPTCGTQSLQTWITALVCAAGLLLPGTLRAQTDVDNVLLMGRNALSFDDNLAAIHYFNLAIEARPSLAKAYYYRAYAKFTLEDFHGAETDCTEAIRLNPFLTDVYRLRALTRLNQADYTGAADDYGHVLTEAADDATSRFNRAICCIENKNLDAADQDLDLLLHRQPAMLHAYSAKAQICLERGDTLAAVDWIDRLLARNDRDRNAWEFKGRYALQKNNYAEADSCLSRAIALAPQAYDNYVARAQARHAMKRFAAAMADYDEAIALVPEHFVAHYNRGLLRALVGENNRAIEDFDFVISLEPDNTLALYNRALLREQTGDLKGAVADYTKLIELYPNFMAGYAARAQLRRRTGDRRGALDDETVVARAGLDITFGKRSRQPVNKVRKRDDHLFEHYDMFVEERADTARLIGDGWFGKVQNNKVEGEILPMFVLTARPHTATTAAYGYTASLHMPELTAMEKENGFPFTLCLMLENKPQSLAATEADIAALNVARTTAELLVRSALYRSIYDYEAALADARAALQTDTASLPAKMQIAAIHAAQNTVEGEPSSREMALHELDALTEAFPKAAYIRYNRGVLRAKMNRTEAALEDFAAAAEMDDRLAEAFYNKGVLLLKAGRPEDAIPDLSRAGELGLYGAYGLLKQAQRNLRKK